MNNDSRDTESESTPAPRQGATNEKGHRWRYIFSILAGLAFLCYFAIDACRSGMPIPLVVFVVMLSNIFPVIAISYYYVVHNANKNVRLSQYSMYAKRRSRIKNWWQSSVDSVEVVNALQTRYQAEYSMTAYVTCLIPAVAIAIIGWSILVLMVAQHADIPFDRNLPAFVYLPKTATLAMGFGFLGAMIFSSQLLYRRFAIQDLKPSIFLRVALALFAGLAFNLVVFFTVEKFPEMGNPAPGLVADQSSTATIKAIGLDTDGMETVITAIIAFSLGYFPSLAIRWFTRISHNVLGEPLRRSDSQRLSVIDGIGIFHEERLNEEGVYNIQDLAFVDIGKLLVRTTFTSGQLLDWVDQARLFLFLDNAETESFRRGGVRTGSDLIDLWSAISGGIVGQHDSNIEEQRNLVALSLQTVPSRLDAIFNSFSDSTPT